jgi:hypothetical protein
MRRQDHQTRRIAGALHERSQRVGEGNLDVDRVGVLEARFVQRLSLRLGDLASTFARMPDGEDDGSPAGAQPGECGGHGRGTRIVEQVGAQLDQIGAVGREQRVDLGIAAGSHQPRTPAERHTADAQRIAHSVLASVCVPICARAPMRSSAPWTLPATLARDPSVTVVAGAHRMPANAARLPSFTPVPAF